MSRQSMPINILLPAVLFLAWFCPVSRLVHSPGSPATVITWKISTRDPCITLNTGIPANIIAKLIFVAFNEGAGISAK